MAGALVILSIEYDPRLLYTRNRVLEEIGGYSVVAARNFREAMEKISGGPHALALIGYTVPRQQRERLESELRRLSPHTPILILCDFPEGEDAGADGYVCSSDGPRVLLGAVSTMVGRGAIQPRRAHIPPAKPGAASA